MDFLQDYLPQALHFYSTYYSPYEAYLNPLRRSLYLSQSYFYRFVFPYLWPAYKAGNKALDMLLTDTPNLATLVILAFVLLISLKLLDLLRRTIIYWISLALRLTMWATIAAIGIYVWQRGVEQSVEDLGWLMGFLAGLEEEGEKIGNIKGSRIANDARRIPKKASRGRTRGAGWN